MGSEVLENGLFALKFARSATLGLVEDIPKDKYCHPLTQGGNHVLWVLGHLAVVDDEFLHTLGARDKKCPESWGKMFGTKSRPSARAGDYPAVDAVTAALAARREELTAHFRSMSDAELNAPVPDSVGRFGSTVASLMSSLAWHEGLHAGQITMIRRALGLGPKFG